MQNEILNSIRVLKNKGILLYPTDTVWGLGCDATCNVAIEKIYQIKQRNVNKSLLVLVRDLQMLCEYVEKIPQETMRILNTFSKPTTVIYKNPKGLSKRIINIDGTVAIRIVKHVFCKELIKQFGKPIVSTSANVSGSSNPCRYDEISDQIKSQANYIVDLDREIARGKSSKIVKIIKNEIITIRN